MEITLVILAAGMGSRFGGLKQITPLGPNGEFIIDYSIYDAIKAGFNKVVFLIKKENYDIFKTTIGSRVEEHIKVEYSFQNNIIKDRVKPLGTAQAILCVKDKVNGPFCVINADDFYGYDAFSKAYQFLSNMHNDSHYGMIGYQIKNTITENGSVKRGVCEVKDDYLTKIIESNVERLDNVIVAKPIDGSTSFTVSDNQTVSMNMLLLNETIFDIIEKDMDLFIKNMKDKMKDEYLIPDVIFNHIKSKDIDMKVIPTTSTWYGVTYKEDSKNVKDALKLLHNSDYPKQLWKEE